jgi:hypothetical protein
MAAISYIKRKSQNLSTAIEAIYGFKISGDADKALKLASETFSELLGFDLGSILDLNTNDFIEMFKSQIFSLSFLELLSKFILNTSEIYSSINRPKEAQNLSEKGILLLKHIAREDKTYSIEREELIKSWEENN